MISLDDYQAREETASLLHSPKNALRLLESIAELES
jgi:antitoxin YefM